MIVYYGVRLTNYGVGVSKKPKKPIKPRKPKKNNQKKIIEKTEP